MPPPVARILVGSVSTSHGLGAAIHGLGDLGNPDYASQINAPALRNQIASQWALLKDPVRPVAEREIVFKLSRHVLQPGQVWTWLGVYREQGFAAAERDGTYIGCGLLAPGMAFEPGEAVPWLLEALQRLGDYSRRGQARDGRVNPIDLAPDKQIFGPVSPATEPWGMSGLQPEREAGLYVDFAHCADDTELYDSEVITFLNRSRTESPFSQYDRVLTGNTARLANVARNLDQIQTHRPDQRKSATPAKAARRPVRAVAIADSSSASSGDGDPIQYMRGDLQALVDKVDRIDNKLQAVLSGRAKKSGDGGGGKEWDAKFFLPLIVIGLAILLGALFIYHQYSKGWSDQVTTLSTAGGETKMSETDDGDNAMSGNGEAAGDTAAAAAGPPGCPLVKDIPLTDKRPDSPDDEALLHGQADCLTANIKRLKDAAAEDKTRLDLLKAQFRKWNNEN